MPVFMGLIKTNQTEAFNNLTFKHRELTISTLRTVKSINKGRWLWKWFGLFCAIVSYLEILWDEMETYVLSQSGSSQLLFCTRCVGYLVSGRVKWIMSGSIIKASQSVSCVSSVTGGHSKIIQSGHTWTYYINQWLEWTFLLFLGKQDLKLINKQYCQF